MQILIITWIQNDFLQALKRHHRHKYLCFGTSHETLSIVHSIVISTLCNGSLRSKYCAELIILTVGLLIRLGKGENKTNCIRYQAVNLFRCS